MLAIPIAVFVGVIFAFMLAYAHLYNNTPYACSLLMLCVSGSALVYKIVELRAEAGIDYYYVALIALFLFSLFSFPFYNRPVAATKYNAWRFTFVIIYAAWTTMFMASSLMPVFGIDRLPRAAPVMQDNYEELDEFDRHFEEKVDQPGMAEEWMIINSILFFGGGFSLNRLFFGRFQWRHLQKYVELVDKYGKVLSDRDSKLFHIKLEKRFGPQEKWNLHAERNNPNNSWEDRITYAYLSDRWYKKKLS